MGACLCLERSRSYETLRSVVPDREIDRACAEYRQPPSPYHNGDGTDIIAEDVKRIVNYGKRYPPRGGTEEFRTPEDTSTLIAWKHFKVDAYA